jgi:hypothetical protein
MPVDGNLYNKIASLNNNAYFKFDVARNNTSATISDYGQEVKPGEPRLNEEGNQYYPTDKNEFYDQSGDNEFNSIYWTGADDLYDADTVDRRIEKNMRYKRN